MRISNNRLNFLIASMLGILTVMIVDIYNSTYVLATAGPTTKLTDTLKFTTSNISTSVQDTVDEVIADTMDILIDNTMNRLENASFIAIAIDQMLNLNLKFHQI